MEQPMATGARPDGRVAGATAGGLAEVVKEPQTAKEFDALRESARRGRPFGSAAWKAETGTRLGLQSPFRPPGRPKKAEPEKGKESRYRNGVCPLFSWEVGPGRQAMER
jgi:hypothetical protein